MATAQEYSGIAQGLNQLSDYMSKSDLRKAQLSEAKSKQQMAQLQLQEFQASAPQRKRQDELEMEALEHKARRANQQALTSLTMSSLDRFEADNNTRHLNTMLEEAKKNPVGSTLYSEVARYDKLTKTENTDKLLRAAGYNPDDVHNNEEVANNFIVVTGNNGEQRLLPKETMYAVTGYTKYIDDAKLEKQTKQARLMQLLKSGVPYKEASMQEKVIQSLIDTKKAANYAEGYEILRSMEASKNGKGVLSSVEERAVAQIMEDQNLDYIPALSLYYETKRQGAGETNESRFITAYKEDNPGATDAEATAAYKNLAKTSTQKENVDVKELRRGLDDIKWLSTPISELSSIDRGRIYSDYISPLEDLRNFKLDAEQKRTIRNLRDLTALGGKAGDKLTAEQTGLLDSTLNKFKGYMFNEVGGKAATSAYESFRNIFRHALYGSSLTKPEIEAFNKAAGTLGQKFLPVMAQLKEQMHTIKVNLESIRDLNDPYIAHYYMGQPIEDIDRAIERIESRINDPMLGPRTDVKQKLLFKKLTPEQKAQRAAEEAEATVPDTGGNVAPAFDFDAAMKEAGL